MSSKASSFEKTVRSLHSRSDACYSTLPSYRSKSYHDDLNQIARLSSSRATSIYDCHRNRYGNKWQTQSLSVHDLSQSDIWRESCNISSINAYAKHYSHHECSAREARLTSRNRFKARAVLKATRSRSVDRSPGSQSREQIRTSTLLDFPLPGLSRSMHDLSCSARSVPRFSITRENTTSRSIKSYHRDWRNVSTSSGDWMYDIMNKPDFYVRWLRQQREISSVSKPWSDSYPPTISGVNDDRYSLTGDRGINKQNRYETRYNFERKYVPPLFAGAMRGNFDIFSPKANCNEAFLHRQLLIRFISHFLLPSVV